MDLSNFIGLMLFMLLFTPAQFILTTIQLSLSRRNEFQADEFAFGQGQGKLLESGLLALFKKNKGTLIIDPL